MRGAAPRGAVATEESAGAIRPCTSPTEVAQAAWRASGTATAGAVRAARKTTGKSAESETAASLWSGRILATSPEAATADLPGGRGAARRPQAGSGPGRSGLPAPLPGHHSTQYGLCFRTGRPRRRGRGSSESPAPLRGREANARPRHAGLPGPAGRHRAAGPGRARAAQTEMVPADWALKPADIGAGEQFRLIFVSSTGRDALSTDIADYNTFVRTRAAAGVTAIQTYANDFTALVSTESVNARTNTLTRATDTDVPIYWVKSGSVDAGDRATDDYADFYDATWKTNALGRNESGGSMAFTSISFWTGTNTDGTTHATQFMGATGSGARVIRWRVQSSSILTSNSPPTSSSYRIAALSPVFQVAGGTPNTAPTAADKTVTTGEDRAYTFTADDFGFDDDDAGATLASVTIVTLPMVGTLALDGTAVMAADVVTKAQIDADMLTFTPARDAHGDPYTTFTFTVNDGTDDSASAYTMTIDVTDAPAPVCGVPSFGDRREIWTGTVTVGALRISGGGRAIFGYGFRSGDEGSLLPSAMFSIGANDYTISLNAVLTDRTLELGLDGAVLTATEVAALRLNVCDED